MMTESKNEEKKILIVGLKKALQLKTSTIRRVGAVVAELTSRTLREEHIRSGESCQSER